MLDALRQCLMPFYQTFQALIDIHGFYYTSRHALRTATKSTGYFGALHPLRTALPAAAVPMTPTA
jgi:hypothetical protein